MNFRELGRFGEFVGINTDVLSKNISLQEQGPSLINYVADLESAIIRNNKIEKMLGIKDFHNIPLSLGSRVLALPIYKKTDGTKKLFAITNTGLWEFSHSTSTWQQLASFNIDTDDVVVSWANIDDKLYFTNTYDGIIRRWDGTSLSTPINHKAKFLLEFKTHLATLYTIETINGSEVEFPQRIWVSNPGTVEAFHEQNKLDIDVEEQILGAKQLGDMIIVYFENGIYAVIWDELGYIAKQIADGVGLIAPNSLCGISHTHFFFSKIGPVAFDGRTIIPIAEAKFKKTMLQEINGAYYHRIIAEYYPTLNQVYFVFPGRGHQWNNVLVIYDPASGEFIAKRTLPFYATCLGTDESVFYTSQDDRSRLGISTRPLIGASGGYVREFSVSDYVNYNSVGHLTSITFPPTFLGFPSNYKRILQLDLIVERVSSGLLELDISISNEANEVWNYVFTLGGTAGTGIRRFELKSDANGKLLDVHGKEFMIKISDRKSLVGWNLIGMILRGHYLGVK